MKKPFLFSLLLISMLTFGVSKAFSRDPKLFFGAGTSVTHDAGAPISELDYEFSAGFKGSNVPDLWAGATILGPQKGNKLNWAWHTGIEDHIGNWSFGIGMAYLARTDSLNGEHANYTLTTAWHFHSIFGWHKEWEIRYRHFSDAGTSPINQGRDMIIFMIRLY